MKVFILSIMLCSLLFSSQKHSKLDFDTCDSYLAKSNRYLYHYVNVAKSTKAKKSAIYMTKSYQDDLLSRCNGVINLSRVRGMKENVDTGYNIFY